MQNSSIFTTLFYFCQARFLLFSGLAFVVCMNMNLSFVNAEPQKVLQVLSEISVEEAIEPTAPVTQIKGPLFIAAAEEKTSTDETSSSSLRGNKVIQEDIWLQKKSPSISASSEKATINSSSIGIETEDGLHVGVGLDQKKNPLDWKSEEKKFYEDPNKKEIDVPVALRMKKKYAIEGGTLTPEVRGTYTPSFTRDDLKNPNAVGDALKKGKNGVGVGLEWMGEDRVGFSFDYDQSVGVRSGDSPSQSVGGKIKVEF